MKNKIKQQQKEEFIQWNISINKGKLFSYSTLNKVLNKFESIRDQMIEDNKISLIRRNSFKVIKNGDSLLKTQYKAIYHTDTKIKDIKYNPYYIKLNKLMELGKLRSNDTLIIKSIKKTLELSTINNQPIETKYLKYKGNRLYYDVTNLPKELRKLIKIRGNKTISFDLSAAQLQLLGTIDFGYGYDNKLFFFIKNSKDIWGDLAKQNCLTREEIKDKFIKSINGRFVYPEIRQIFPQFFFNLDCFKKELGYKAVSELYFQIEKDIMSNIMTELAINNINFLPIHDCLIVEEKNYEVVSNSFKRNNLKYKIEY